MKESKLLHLHPIMNEDTAMQLKNVRFSCLEEELANNARKLAKPS